LRPYRLYLSGMASPRFYVHEKDHVELRTGLSPVLRKTIFDIPRETWQENPRFRGEPEFWTQIHKDLLSGSATLAAWSEQFLDNEHHARRAEMARQISGLGNQLVHHAHAHHHIEDHHFFPVFMRIFPQLEPALELLDSDHKVLGEVLDDLEKAIGNFPVAPEGNEQQHRDAWLNAAELLLPAAKRLDRLFVRHINDEEEICIPTMLKL
jgi:hypothetical protein